jgi:hypothetical protein
VAPWSLLQRLPVLRDLRVPSRHLVLMALGLGLGAGVALDQVGDWMVERWGEPGRLRWRRLAWAVVALSAVDGAAYTAWCYRGVFTVALDPPHGPPMGAVPFYHLEGGWQSMRDVLYAGHGSLGCDEEAPLQRAEALDPGEVPQERLLDPSAGEVVGAEWSPDRRAATVRLDRGTVLLLNSNWNEHWLLDAGPPGARVTKLAGRLAVDLRPVPPGRYRVALVYAPRSFSVGCAVSAVALPLALGLFLLGRSRRRRAAAARGASLPA